MSSVLQLLADSLPRLAAERPLFHSEADDLQLASGLDHASGGAGRWANTMGFWAGPQLLIVDELGYLPMPGEAASHLFQVISRRYEHGSIVLTTNRGIADWGHIEDTTVATTVLDRLLHHASVLSVTGDSYRMRRHRDVINALRPALTGRAEGGEFS
jgi:hypothetical protein